MTVKPLNRINQNLDQDFGVSMGVVERNWSINDSENQNQETTVSTDSGGQNGESGDGKINNRKACTQAVEVDQESGGSSTEEVESPKPVAKFARKKSGRFVHSQVLRVKEEEMLVGEDIVEGCLSFKDKKSDYHPQERHVNIVVFSRLILPCSPLSGKNTPTGFKTAPMH